MDYAIHWFRRDLRVAGNTALQEQFKRHKGKVVGLFCFDKEFLSRGDFSHNRFIFFLNTLVELKKELKSLGSDLLFMDVGPKDAFTKLFNELEALPKSISFSRDYEPFALKRDKLLMELFKERGIDCYHYRDHLLIEPWELKNNQQAPYKVFTPFYKKWSELFHQTKINDRVIRHNKSFHYLNSYKENNIRPFFSLNWDEVLLKRDDDKLLDYYLEKSKKQNTKKVPKAGSQAAFECLIDFSSRLKSYNKDRDNLAKDSNSHLAMYLKNGSITISQIIYYLDLKVDDPFLRQLVWREFYFHIMYHEPRVEVESFQKKYIDLKWENDKALFKKWKEAKTGFPIVDAAMRELVTTGFMHNRARMIVASFLVKDLLIDWKWGEKFFMKHLYDGDLAANNGGWQWAASTGVDAQPYFRIFNPWTQSKRFDPNGEYIRKYLPEISNLSNKELHRPIIDHPSYPSPVVDHATQRQKVLLLFKV